LPFILAGLSIFHIAALHQYGSTNPLGVNTQTSTIPFGTYFASKDLLGFLYLALAFCVLVFFYPEYLGHPDNLIPANPYSTPQHIVPEPQGLRMLLRNILRLSCPLDRIA
jgi:ubiquinol-cytochrome c reductase cytochrome b subunit